MRLLYRNSDGQYAFKEVADANGEQYAILSHRWYPEGEDVLFADVVNQNKKDVMSKSGWRKVNYALNQASADEINYVWIDTCCIDKTSSAELSEAINSMFFWYREARVCYAYLWDISNDWSIRETAESDEAAQKRNSAIICSSEWFERGWYAVSVLLIEERFLHSLGPSKSSSLPVRSSSMMGNGRSKAARRALKKL